MGTYVSESDVRTLMPQFSMVVTASAAYSKTSDIINKAISRAEAITNSYVGCRYSLPFTSTAIPVQVREEALALSVAYTYRWHYPPDNINRNEYYESFKDDENNAIENLKAIGNGDMKLTLTDGSLVAVSSNLRGARSNTQDFQPVFDLDSVTAWKPDDDYLDEVKNAR